MGFLSSFGDALNIGGKIFGMFNDSAEDQREDIRNQQLRNEALQREFAQNGIQWRVADAQAAGVHPLFALGGSGASYSPNPIAVGGSGPDIGSALSDMGQSVSRAATAGMSAEEKAIHSAQLRLLESQIAKTAEEAAAVRSQRIRDEQANFNTVFKPDDVMAAPMLDYALKPWQIEKLDYLDRRSSGGGAGAPGGIRVSDATGRRGPTDMIQPKPDEVISSRGGFPNITAGDSPFWRAWTWGKNGRRIFMPWSDEGPVNELPLWTLPLIAMYNLFGNTPDRAGGRGGSARPRGGRNMLQLPPHVR